MRNGDSMEPDESLDRLPPHSPEAEQGVLGCTLLDPQQCLPECIEKFNAGAKVFYDLRHQTIFETMVELYDDRDPIDIITLQERLNIWGMLEQCGGIAYLSTLPETVPSAANLSSYVDIVLEKYFLRQMVRVCTDVVTRVYRFEGEFETFMDEAERDVLRINESRSQPETYTTKELVRRSLSRMEEAGANPGKVFGIATGFVDLDRLTGGFRGGEMIVIAARPSVGKSSLAMNIADYVAVTNNIPAGVFSLEMSADSLMDRMMASRARVNLRSIRDGYFAERDFPGITLAAAKIQNAPLYIDDTRGLSVLQLRAKARRMWQRYGIKILFIDYLQLLNALGNKRRFESRQQEVSDISTGIKNLAGELNIPIVVLSQLNRDVEREKTRKPRLSDLRESGSIEQDADTVGFLYRPKNGDEGDYDPNQPAEPINLLLAKQRNGPADVDVNLTFLKPYTRFESAAKVSDEDVPAQQTFNT